jgi:hypothetical protein
MRAKAKTMDAGITLNTVRFETTRTLQLADDHFEYCY